MLNKKYTVIALSCLATTGYAQPDLAQVRRDSSHYYLNYPSPEDEKRDKARLNLEFSQDNQLRYPVDNSVLQSNRPFLDSKMSSMVRLLSYPVIMRALQGDPLMQSFAGCISLLFDDFQRATYWFELAASRNDEFSKQALEILSRHPEPKFILSLIEQLPNEEPVNLLHQYVYNEFIGNPEAFSESMQLSLIYKSIPQVELYQFVNNLRFRPEMQSAPLDLGVYNTHPIKKLISTLEKGINDSSSFEDEIDIFDAFLSLGFDEALLGKAAIYLDDEIFDEHFDELYKSVRSKKDNPLLQGICGCYLLGNTDRTAEALELIQLAWQQYPKILECLQISEPGEARLYKLPACYKTGEYYTDHAVFFFYELLQSDAFYPLLDRTEFVQVQNALELFLIKHSCCKKITMHAAFMRLIRIRQIANNDRTKTLYDYSDIQLLEHIIACDERDANLTEQKMLQFAYYELSVANI